MPSQFIKQVRGAVKHWYLSLIVGIILIATAIWTFMSPMEAYLALSLFFGISFLVSGLLEAFFAIANRSEIENWGWLLVLGILSAVVGGILVSHPGLSMATLPMYVGFVVLFRSFAAIGIAMDLKSYGVMDWGTLMVVGVLGVLFAFVLLWNPIFAGMTVVFWTGMALLLGGIFNVYLAFKMRSLHKNWNELSAGLKEKYDEVRRQIQAEMSRNA